MRLSFDLTSQFAAFNQEITTRTRAVPVVNNGAPDPVTGYPTSDAVTYDVVVTLNQWFHAQIKIGAGTIAATTRNPFAELLEPQLYGIGKALFEAWTGLFTVANFDKTAILNRQGYVLGANPDRTSLIGIDNDLDTLLNPEENRVAIMATDVYNALRKDPSLVSYWQAGPESEARKSGDLGERENLMPYKTQSFNGRADGVKGAAMTASATAVVSRLPNQVASIAGISFPGTQDIVTEPDTKLSVLVTKWVQPDGSFAAVRPEVLFGGGVGQPNAGLLLL